MYNLALQISSSDVDHLLPNRLLLKKMVFRQLHSEINHHVTVFSTFTPVILKLVQHFLDAIYDSLRVRLACLEILLLLFIHVQPHPEVI